MAFPTGPGNRWHIPNMNAAWFNANHDINWGALRASLWTDAFDGSTTALQSLNTVAGEFAGAGYTPGGVALANSSLVVDEHGIELTADDLSWAGVTWAGVRGVVLHDPNATLPVANPIIATYNFGADAENDGGTFAVPWPNGYVFRLRNPGAP